MWTSECESPDTEFVTYSRKSVAIYSKIHIHTFIIFHRSLTFCAFIIFVIQDSVVTTPHTNVRNVTFASTDQLNKIPQVFPLPKFQLLIVLYIVQFFFCEFAVKPGYLQNAAEFKGDRDSYATSAVYSACMVSSLE